jgi:Protein of unknown function (DUF3285)
METPNASSEANVSEPAETASEPNTMPASLAAVDGVSIADTGTTSGESKPSYVKLAMRNMVRKRGLSLQHFALTTVGLLAFLVGLSYLTR